jgi:DNA-binding ferritin-like protein
MIMDTNMSLQTTTEAAIAKFDYNSVDSDMASFLKERAKRILDIRMKSILSIGKELAEAQAKLASHNKYEGIFTKWIESMGFSKSTAYNYIQVHGYVVQNLDNIHDPEKLQPSLLLAISKPSAPPELQERVVSGDIKTHKEYQELLSKYNQAMDDKQQESRKRQDVESNLIVSNQALQKTQDALKRAQESISKKIEAKDSEIKTLSEKLAAAKESGDPGKIKNLQKLLAEYERDIDALNHENMELKSRPIDVAVHEKVVIPQNILDELDTLRESAPAYQDFNLVMATLKSFAGLTGTQIKNWAQVLNEIPDSYEYYINSAGGTLELM